MLDSRNTSDKSGTTHLHDVWNYAKLENTTLSEIVHGIERNGLANREEAYMCIIPPLSCTDKLPGEVVVNLFRERYHLQDAPLRRVWFAMTAPYERLIDLVIWMDLEDRFAVKALAVVVEFSRSALGLEYELDYQEQVLRWCSDQLKKPGKREILVGIQYLYSLRPHDEEYKKLFGHILSSTGDSNSEEIREHSGSGIVSPGRYRSAIFRHTPLHQAIIEKSMWDLDVMKRYVDAPDILGLTPLHYVAIFDDWLDVEILGVRGGANPNSRDIAGRSPLHYAALFDRYHVMGLLTSYGAEVGARGVDGIQPLHLAAKMGHHSIIQSLAITGARIDSLDNCQRTPLHWAVISCLATPQDANHTSQTIHLLFNNGAKLNLTDGSGRTPLNLAIELARWEAAKILIERGADIYIKYNGETTIHQLASRECPPEVIILTLKAGADVDSKTDSGLTPLQIAVRMNLFENTQTLLGNGANPNAQCLDTRNPLHTAASVGNVPLIRELLENRADPNIADGSGHNALHWISYNTCYPEIINLLLDRELDPNLQKNNGYTALHLAIEYSETQTPQILLDSSTTDVNVTNNDGKTALHIAAEGSIEDSLAKISLLSQKGADVYIKDINGKTALDLARDGDNDDKVRLIEEHSREPPA